jgi:signal transduction histidine kinase
MWEKIGHFREMIKKETFDNEFISHVTHELRTPVTLIKGFSQVIIEDEDMDEESKKDFIRIIYIMKAANFQV